MVRADAGRVLPETGQNGGDPALGRLLVLPAGVSPSHPSDLIALPSLGHALATLRAQFEILIVDAPPLVQGGDGMALATHADALLIVTKLAGVRREGLQELRRRLADIPVPAIGVAVTDAERDDSDRWRRYYRADPIPTPGETAVR
jgi:receptor protein-tyrosine kinase